jgi:DNA-binding response OmpR family regulator
MGKGRILIIDDEPDIVETLTFMLKARNYDVITAFDGQEGLVKVKTENPDLALLDIMMPGIDGYDVCSKIKSDKDTKKLPVIMLTAKGEGDAVIKAHKSGADDYIVKPFSLPTLVSKLNKLLAK